MFELTVLGAGPAYTARPGAVGAAYLLRTESSALVLDLGQGAFTNLAGAIEPSSVDGYAISHLHPDHFIDLVALRHYLRWDFVPPRRVRVLGPAGLGARIDALHAQPGFAAASLDLEPLGASAAGIRDIGSFRLEARLVRHTDESYAFRVTAGDGPGLVYTGDCGHADDVRPLLQPGDTLLAEASYGTAEVAAGSEHLNASAVGRLAADASAGRVLLTHVLMGHHHGAADAVRDLAGVEATTVDPGDRFTI
jgi:ribonuclease BN (tRNA processing enzyme)